MAKTAKHKLTPKQEMFCREYLVDLNATQAAIRAGYSKKTAEQQGARLLRNVKVAERISKLQAKRSEKVDITTEKVLAEYWNIATVDRRELVEVRRNCCRYCYGKDFRYQRTRGELERDLAQHDLVEQKRQETDAEYVPKPFDEAGGIGYDPRKIPHPDCPECFGEGIEQVFIRDTRSLSPSAASVYAGAKQGKDGIEVKAYDKDKALEMVGKHLGMFVDRKILQNPDGSNLIPSSVDVNLNPSEAYFRLINGGMPTQEGA